MVWKDNHQDASIEYMKKILMGLVGVIFLAPITTFADVPPGPDYHYVERCAQIVNQNDFPEITLIVYTTGPMTSPKEGKLLQQGTCITAYKFSSASVYYIQTNKLSSIDLNNLAFNTKKVSSSTGYMYETPYPSSLLVLMENIPFYAGYAKNTDHRKKESVEYSIVKKSDGTYFLYKSKTTTSFNNGKADKVEIFSQSGQLIKPSVKQDTIGEKDEKLEPVAPPAPIVVKRNFFQKILCFFRISKSC
jgi:hypothetical protein